MTQGEVKLVCQVCGFTFRLEADSKRQALRNCLACNSNKVKMHKIKAEHLVKYDRSADDVPDHLIPPS